MGTLASVLEDAGLATVALSSVRGQVVTTRPPRALHCDFPLGRPLGRPQQVECPSNQPTGGQVHDDVADHHHERRTTGDGGHRLSDG